jgi:hypothetical protein
MDRTMKRWLAAPVACGLLALAGCAMLEGETMTTSEAPSRSAMGGSPYMPTALNPGECIKFDALPPECERLIPR